MANAAFLLAEPMPFLVAPFAIALYSSVHALLSITGLGNALIALHSSPRTSLLVDFPVAAIDAVCRTEAIANLGQSIAQHHPNAAVASSLGVQVMIGALVSGGVPLFASALNLSSPTGQWAIMMPSWLQRPSLLLYGDLWGGAAVALVLALLNRSDAQARFPWLSPASLASWLTMHPSHARHKSPLEHIHGLPYLSRREAKAVSVVTLLVFLIVPILVRHAAAAAITRSAPHVSSKKEIAPMATRTSRRERQARKRT